MWRRLIHLKKAVTFAYAADSAHLVFNFAVTHGFDNVDSHFGGRDARSELLGL